MWRLWEEDLHGWIREIMTCCFWTRQILWQHSRNARDLYISCIEEIAYKQRLYRQRTSFIKLAEPLMKTALRPVSDGNCGGTV